MRIAVSSTGKDLDSRLDPRFGRCAYFLVVDSDFMDFEAYPNESASLGGGAGIQAAQLLASKNVQAVITGNCGPNAVHTLSAAGIELFVGQQGTVKEVVNKYVTGGLKPTNAPTVDSHWGMGTGTGMGRGGGAGRGMGSHMGMGSAFNPSGNRSVGNQAEDKVTGNQELENLREQAERLNQQMQALLERIENFQKT